ncbi:heptaprenyl diphosphate synthase [Natronobacillus azotifigens]|uniref:Heptaprenyl diphosphate synthase component 2 n=1 Tax=Natronobacillus azotifigens TaxID=472978 RepID=A0A9J6R971_9BACI|nr:heptaprenyl diphosphate synthase component II [Natronobacillus azotifigens]MCZ0701859.1 heptaprenyl diphosphate synthase component II [Natronobacillus azotifigens]
MKLALTYSYLNADLKVIEQELQETLRAEHPVLAEASSQLLHAGGKRLRPVFVLLAAQFGDYDLEKVKTAAITLELIHMASLVHDDVIDESELRRGKPTVKANWDNRTAMYTGDYIFARALECLSTLNTPTAHQLLSKTMVELTLGEMKQIEDKYRLNQSFKDYLRRIRRKTALLIAASCQLGAIAVDAPEFVQRKLYLYGYYVGISYQIIDDILDFTASSKQLGKPAGSDLIQGQITLPTLIALQDQKVSHQLKKIFSVTKEPTSIEMEPIIELIKHSDAIERSYQISEAYLQKAFSTLKALPDVKAKQTFEQIAIYIGKRKT